MRHGSQHKRFLDATNYQMASVIVKKDLVQWIQYFDLIL